MLHRHEEIDWLAKILSGVVFPEGCQEVTFELETRDDLSERWSGLHQQAIICQQLALLRSDGLQLTFDDKLALPYTWTGCGQARLGSGGVSRPMEGKDYHSMRMDYHTIKLCWHAKVARREYVSYDRLDCVGVGGCKEIKNVVPLELRVVV